MRVQEVFKSDGTTGYILVDSGGEVVQPVAQFLRFLDFSGRARNTLRGYAYDLSLYFQFLYEAGLDWQRITVDDLSGMIGWLRNPYRSTQLWPQHPVEAARANSSINRVIGTVVRFQDYFWRRNLAETDIHDASTTYIAAKFRPYKGFLYHLARDSMAEMSILKQKVATGRPDTLSRQQITALVQACGNMRDELLLRLLFQTSVRIGEALALWLEDVDVTRRKIRIRDRGQLANGAEIKTPLSQRQLSMEPDLINRISMYIAIHHTEEVTTNHLFLKLRGPRKGEPMGYAEVNDLFKRLEKHTGIRAWPHLFRHTSLTILAEHGLPPEHLQRRAGHAQFQSSQIYVHPTDAALEREFARIQSHLALELANGPE